MCKDNKRSKMYLPDVFAVPASVADGGPLEAPQVSWSCFHQLPVSQRSSRPAEVLWKQGSSFSLAVSEGAEVVLML